MIIRDNFISMLAYIVMYLAVLFGVINHKDAKVGYFVWAILLFFSIFRDASVGSDTSSYLDINYFYFRAMGLFEFDRTSSMELLTNSVYYLVILTGISTRWIIVFFSVTTFVFLLLLAKKTNIKLCYIMMVFLLGGGYIYSFNIARQWSSLAIIAYAMSYILDKSLKKSLLFFPFLILACTIHFLSFFYVFLYIFRFVKVKLTVATVILIVGFLLSLMTTIASRLEFVEILGDYADTYSEVLEERKLGRSLFGYLFSLIFLVFYYVVMIRMNKLRFYNLLPLFVFCIVVYSFSAQFNSVVHRFFLLFSFMSAVIVAKYFTIERDKSTQLVMLISYLTISTYTFFSGGIVDSYTFMF